MTISEDEAVARALHSIETALDHAVAYKRLFHDMQDRAQELEDKCIAQNVVIKRQRALIEKLEKRLGIDQEL